MSGEKFTSNQEVNLDVNHEESKESSREHTQNRGAEVLSGVLGERKEPEDEIGFGGEREQSPEERQVDDLEVLFSFCDEKDVLEILRSNEYGVLLKNNVSLMDLFNANALFDEQYYADGYTKDKWRREGDPHNVFDLLGISGDKFSDDRMSAVKEKRSDRRFVIESRYRSEGMMIEERWQNSDKNTELKRPSGEELDEMYFGPDKKRAQEAKETIAIIANSYFGENVSPESADELKQIISLRAEGKDLSDEQKDFLKDQMNIVTDRLLYDGHVINEERAGDIMGGLDYAINRYNEDINSEAGERNKNIYRGTLVSNMAYAKVAIDDFLKAGEPDLVYEAQQKLSEMVDDYFDIIVSTDMIHMSDDVNRFDAIDDLVFRYSNPYRLIERAKEYNLCGREYDWMDNDKYIIRNPDKIVGAIVKDAQTEYGSAMAMDVILAEMSKDLKEVGVSDEAILDIRDSLGVKDFNDKDFARWYKGSVVGRMLEAGIDKGKIAKKLFIDTQYLFAIDQTDDDPYSPDIPESMFDTMERNGFTATEIAVASTPDVLSKNLAKFLDKGADAEKILTHMASYREKFKKNIMRDAKGDIEGYHKMWFDGVQEMVVWDKDHPEGRMVLKEGMAGDGVDYIAMNLDTFAENGVTEEDIINEVSAGQMNPHGFFIPKMLECDKFDKQKIMNLGYKKYLEHLKDMQKAGIYDEEYVNTASDPANYYSHIVEKMGAKAKERRDEYYQSLVGE